MFEYCSEATAERAIATVVSVEPVQGNTHPTPDPPFRKCLCSMLHFRPFEVCRHCALRMLWRTIQVCLANERSLREIGCLLPDMVVVIESAGFPFGSSVHPTARARPLDAAAGSVCRAVRHCAIRQRALAASRGHYLPGAVHRRHRSQLQCRHVRYVSKG